MKAVSKIIEALISTVLIISAFSVSYYLLIPSSASHVRSADELQKFGYNLMRKLSSNEAFENIFLDINGKPHGDWEDRLKIAINSFLPSNVIFEVNVYKSIKPENSEYGPITELASLKKVNDKRISNADNESVFTYVGATAQVTYIYTMENMTTLVFDLRLADLGGR
ncbi:MAG: hypothetical protein QW076_06215 [Candidatus Anstonellales archaeon]